MIHDKMNDTISAKAMAYLLQGLHYADIEKRLIHDGYEISTVYATMSNAKTNEYLIFKEIGKRHILSGKLLSEVLFMFSNQGVSIESLEALKVPLESIYRKKILRDEGSNLKVNQTIPTLLTILIIVACYWIDSTFGTLALILFGVIFIGRQMRINKKK